MTKLDRMIQMDKTAAPTWLRNTGTGLGVGMGLYFASLSGKQIGKDVASLSHKGKIGLKGEAQWKDERDSFVRKNVDRKALNTAKKKQGLFGNIGLLGGAAAVLPFRRNPLLVAGGALVGRSVARSLAKKRNPILNVEDMNPLDARVGKSRGLLTAKQSKGWQSLLNAPEVESNPALKNRLINQLETMTERNPKYQAYAKKQKTGSTIGSILGVGAMAAGMLYGKKKKWFTTESLNALMKKKNISRARAMIKMTPTNFQSRVGGSTWLPWAGLGVAGVALGTAKRIEGNRRAGIDNKRARSKILEQALSETGTNLLFYGGGA